MKDTNYKDYRNYRVHITPEHRAMLAAIEMLELTSASKILSTALAEYLDRQAVEDQRLREIVAISQGAGS